MSRPPSQTVFIGNIPYDVTEAQLQEVFSGVGQVKSLRLVTDKETGKLKGYGFCEYYDRAAAECAVQNLNQHEVSGRQLRVDFAEDQAREERRDDRGGRGPAPHFRDGRPVGGPGTKPVGQAAASSAAGTMAAMLGGPPGPGPTQDHVNGVLGGMSPMQLFDVMSQMRSMITQDPARARHTLISNPQLTKALFQAQILLGMVKPPPSAAPPAAGPGAPAQGPPPHLGAPPLQVAPPGAAPVIVAAGPPPGQYGAPPPGQYLPPQPGIMQPPPGQYIQAPPGQMVVGPGPQMMIGQPPAPQPQMVAPPAAAPVVLPTDQQALLAQVMSMTQDQIDALPDATRAQVLQVKQLLMAQHGLQQ